MEFTYTDTFYVCENDIAYMTDLVIYDNYSAEEAVDSWSEALDEADYYAVGHIEEALIEEINNRVKKLKRKFSTNACCSKKINSIIDELLFVYSCNSPGIRVGDNHHTYEPENEKGLKMLECLRDLDLIEEVLDK